MSNTIGTQQELSILEHYFGITIHTFAANNIGNGYKLQAILCRQNNLIFLKGLDPDTGNELLILFQSLFGFHNLYGLGNRMNELFATYRRNEISNGTIPN